MCEPRASGWIIALMAAAGVLGFSWGVGSAQVSVAPGPEVKASAPPPLQVEQGAPLLLDEPAEEVTAPKTDPEHPAADNAKCFVCHANFKEEPFVLWHAKANIGCVRCHGNSADHIADENNLTPPNAMYWPSRVGLSCYGCHPEHKAPARDVILRWQERLAGKADPKRVLCTDCHGEHRLKLRTIVWNKRTGALISKVRAVSTNAPPRTTLLQQPCATPGGGPLAVGTSVSGATLK
jgi:uncharacterized CHY-type Zn-finger protein